MGESSTILIGVFDNFGW